MFHSPCPSQCTMAQVHVRAASLLQYSDHAFYTSIPVFSHTQLNGNPSRIYTYPAQSQSCLYLSVIAVPCCLQSDRRGSAMNCSVIKVNARAPFESLIFNISRTLVGKKIPSENTININSNTETEHFTLFGKNGGWWWILQHHPF